MYVNLYIHANPLRNIRVVICKYQGDSPCRHLVSDLMALNDLTEARHSKMFDSTRLSKTCCMILHTIICHIYLFYFIYLFASDTHNLDHMYPYQLLVAVAKKKRKTVLEGKRETILAIITEFLKKSLSIHV